MLIERRHTELKEWVTAKMDQHNKWVEGELQDTSSFNSRADQRIAMIAEATVEARSLAKDAKQEAESANHSLEELEQRLISLEETIENQSQQVWSVLS